MTTVIFSGQFAMLSRALWMKGVGNTSTHRAVCLTVQRRLQSQDSGAEKQSLEFDERVLEHLVCPLSKKDLRYKFNVFFLFLSRALLLFSSSASSFKPWSTS